MDQNYRLWTQPILGSFWLSAAVLILLILLILYFRPVSNRLTLRRLRILLGLRLMLLGILFWLMLRPVLLYTETIPLPASLTFLIDQSQSMSVQDELGGKSRYELLKQTLTDFQSELQSFNEKYELNYLTFDSQIFPIEKETGLPKLGNIPEGKETALGYSLDQTLKKIGGKRGLGVILLTDGTQKSQPPRDQLPQDTALKYRDAGIPIYALCFGKSGSIGTTQDISVRSLLSNEQVFVKNELKVSGDVRVFGYAGKTIPIRFLFETPAGQMQEVETTELKIVSDDQTIPYQFSWIPETPGEWKLTVDIPPLEKELIKTNNQLSGFVRVIDGGLNVLYLEGTRRFEQKYLRMALESSADIHVDYWRPDPNQSGFQVSDRSNNSVSSKNPNIPGGSNNFNELNNVSNNNSSNLSETERISSNTNSRDSLIDSLFRPGAYSAYIIGDVDSSAFKSEELTALANAVRDGSGLIMLGGERTFSAGGYAQTPLADLLPVQMSPEDRLSLNVDPETENTFSEFLRIGKPTRMLPSDFGKSHYLMRFSNDLVKNLEIWNELPELDGAVRLGKPKTASTILAVGNAGRESVPLLVSQLYGLGRVLAFAGDSTWKWQMQGFENEHKKFWRQTILWLARMDELAEGELRVQMEKTRFFQNESVPFRVVYLPKPGEKTDNFLLKAAVIGPNGKQENIPLLDDSGVFSGTFRQTEQQGDYRIQATLISKETNQEIQKSQARFSVHEQNMELDQPVATPSALARIAEISQGKTLLPEELPKLLSEIAKNGTELTETRETKKTLYDSWIVFFGFLGIASLEWFLRKHWGLI